MKSVDGLRTPVRVLINYYVNPDACCVLVIQYVLGIKDYETYVGRRLAPRDMRQTTSL